VLGFKGRGVREREREKRMDTIINNKVTQYLYLPQMWYGLEKGSKETWKLTEFLLRRPQQGGDDIVQTSK